MICSLKKCAICQRNHKHIVKSYTTSGQFALSNALVDALLLKRSTKKEKLTFTLISKLEQASLFISYICMILHIMYAFEMIRFHFSSKMYT